MLNTGSLRPPLTGIGNYTFNLLREITKLSVIDEIECFDGNHWRTAQEQLTAVAVQAQLGDRLSSEKISKPSIELRKFIRSIPFAYKLRAKLLSKSFARRLNSFGQAVYHDPNFILNDYKGPSVVTVHDLSFLHYPQFHPKERVAWLTRELPKTLSRADFVITDSELVRTELMERFRVPPDRSKAIYLGADDSFKPRTAAQVNKALAQLGLTNNAYVLFVGTLEPRKGLESLLDAWQMLPEPLKKTYPLVIAGASGWRNTELLSRIKKLSISGGVHFLEYVHVDVLPFLYSGAAVSVSPSIYEGFGLPVLEAMSSGSAVICKEGTAMAEFSAGSCMLFHTEKPDELSHKLKCLLVDENLRAKYALQGLNRANEFSWGRCAEQTVNVYRQVM